MQLNNDDIRKNIIDQIKRRNELANNPFKIELTSDEYMKLMSYSRSDGYSHNSYKELRDENLELKKQLLEKQERLLSDAKEIASLMNRINILQRQLNNIGNGTTNTIISKNEVDTNGDNSSYSGWFYSSLKSLYISPNPDYWTLDADAKDCSKCKKQLVYIHHCRQCGYHFCEECSNFKRMVKSRGYNGLQRVCIDCLDKPDCL